MAKELKRQLVIQALENASTDTSTNSIAKALYKLYPQLWKDKEACRHQVRRWRGELHKEPPAKAVGQRTKEQKQQAYAWNKLPKSHAEKHEDFILPKACNRILLLSDIHIPYHDERALITALEYGMKNNVNCIYLNGDIIDCYQLSRYVKDPKAIDIGTELEMLKDFLALIKSEFKCPVYYKIGNHEDRFQVFLKTKAPELLSISDFRLDILCRFGELGIIQVDSHIKTKAGKLNIMHGHEFGRSLFSPVNIARGAFLRAKASVIVGHHHQTSEHTERDLNDKMITTWSTGCLSELKPKWLPVNRWNHGAAIIHVNEDDTFEVNNFRIIDGKVY